MVLRIFSPPALNQHGRQLLDHLSSSTKIEAIVPRNPPALSMSEEATSDSISAFRGQQRAPQLLQHNIGGAAPALDRFLGPTGNKLLQRLCLQSVSVPYSRHPGCELAGRLFGTDLHCSHCSELHTLAPSLRSSAPTGSIPPASDRGCPLSYPETPAFE